MSIEISSENQQFLEAVVASGAFASREAAIDQAISLLRERQEALARICEQDAALPELPSLLVRQEDGYVSVRGHRIGLHLILERFFAGDRRAEIQDRFSSLSPGEVDAILDFVGEHRDAMQVYLDRQQLIEKPSNEKGSRGPTVAELRARWLSNFGRPLEIPCR
jgi:Arc/MetJ-type ribon-helix-helix transcriptional regulator